MANSGAKTREIILLGPFTELSQVQKSLKAHLDNAFKDLPGSPFDWSFIHLPQTQDLGLRLTQQEAPLLVFCDTSSNFDSVTWDQAFGGLRKIDPSCCILVQSTQESPSAETAISWLDRGTSGLFNLKSSPESTEDVLRDLLSKPLRIKFPRKLRMTSRHVIELQVASLEQALVTETLNIGLGGLFIRSVPQGINIGDEVEFVLKFSPFVSDNTPLGQQNPLVTLINEEPSLSTSTGAKASHELKEIRGTGSVVWVRKTPQPDSPEGIGLQFIEVETESLNYLKDFIANHRIKAFIPKA